MAFGTTTTTTVCNDARDVHSLKFHRILWTKHGLELYIVARRGRAKDK